MALKDGLLAEFDHEMGTTRKLLERVPETADRLAWKPHAKSMSLGGVCTHLANLPNWGARILTESSFDLASAPPALEELTSRLAIVGLFTDATRTARAALDSCCGAVRRCSRCRARRRSARSCSTTPYTIGVS